MKKKMMILNIGFVLIMLISYALIVYKGNEYYLTINKNEPGFKINKINIQYSKDGVVKETDIYQDEDDKDKNIVIFESVNPGRTNVDIKYTLRNNIGIEKKYTYKTDLEVNLFGLIIDHNLGNFSGYDVAVNSIIFMMIWVEIIMLWVFVDCIIRGNFSYSMITVGTISIFNGILLFFNIYKLFRNFIPTFQSFTDIVADIGYQTLSLFGPLMFIMAIALVVSNIRLMRHEGKRLVNGLGIVFGLTWVIGTIVALGPMLFFANLGLPDVFVRSVIYILSYFECLFITTVLCSFLAVRYTPEKDRDYIIILGCGIVIKVNSFSTNSQDANACNTHSI